jgi:hypothetical protein
MGRGGRIRHRSRHRGGGRRLPALPPDPVPTAIYGLQMQGSDPMCGCPFKWCHAQASVVASVGVPPELASIYSEQEWSKMKRHIDDTYDSTAFPFFPCIFTHFCIPFFPVCVMCCCESRRTSKMKDWADQENARLAVQGLKWIPTPRRLGIPWALIWLADVRPQFEAREPGARQYMREGLPPVFWLAEDKKAWIDMLAASPDPGSSPSTGDGNDERSRQFRVHLQRKMMLAANMNIEALGIFFAPSQQQQMQQQPMMMQGPPQQQSMGGGVEMQQMQPMQMQQPQQQYMMQPQQPYMQPQPLFVQQQQQQQQLYAQPQQQMYMQQQQPPLYAAPLQQLPVHPQSAQVQVQPASPQSTESQQSQALSPPGGLDPQSLYTPASPSGVGGGTGLEGEPSAPMPPSSSSAPMMMAFCPSCGARKVDPRSPLCLSCGACN